MTWGSPDSPLSFWHFTVLTWTTLGGLPPVMGWLVFPKKTCWRPKPQYLWTGPYLQIGSAELIKLRWDQRVDPNSTRWSCEDTETQGERHVKIKVENGVMCLQGKQCPVLLTIIRSWGKGMDHILPQSSQKESVLPTLWFWTLGLQNMERTHFCCSKPPSLQYFVTAALGNSDHLYENCPQEF